MVVAHVHIRRSNQKHIHHSSLWRRSPCCNSHLVSVGLSSAPHSGHNSLVVEVGEGTVLRWRWEQTLRDKSDTWITCFWRARGQLSAYTTDIPFSGHKHLPLSLKYVDMRHFYRSSVPQWQRREYVPTQLTSAVIILIVTMTVIIIALPSIVIVVSPPVRRTTASWPSGAILGIAIASVVSPTIIVASSLCHRHPQLGSGPHPPSIQALFHPDCESILCLQLKTNRV